MADQQITGLPEGAEVTPIAAQPNAQTAQIPGLPEGAEVTPISNQAQGQDKTAAPVTKYPDQIENQNHGTGEPTNLLDQGIQGVGKFADTVANKLHVKAGAEAVKTAIQGWHDPKSQLASIPDDIKGAAGAAYDAAAAKMAAMHKQVAEDQEASKNAQTLMKEGKLTEAAALLNRHMAIRATQHIADMPGNHMVANMAKGMGEDAGEAVENVKHGEYAKAAGDVASAVAPWLVGGEAAEAGKGAEAAGAGAEAAGAADASAAAATPAAPASKAVAPGALRPGVADVAGNAIPIRATGPAAKAAETVADTGALKDFEFNKTQPAVRQAVANVTGKAAGLEGIADTSTKEDPFGFGAHNDALKATHKPTFEKLDKASGGAFNEAQVAADDSRLDFSAAGRKAYREALDKQEGIFDSVKALAGKGETPDLTVEQLQDAKDGWRKSVAFDDLQSKFNPTVHAGPADQLEQGAVDRGYVNPKQFREAITDAAQKTKTRPSVFSRAGFTPEHVQAIEDLGRILEKQQVNSSKFKDVIGHLAGLVGAGSLLHFGGEGLVAGALAGEAAGNLAKWGAGKVVSKIMTSERAVSMLNQGIKSGASSDTIASMLKGLWQSETGSAEIPFTGTMGNIDRVGTAEGAKADTAFFKQAQAEKPTASLSEQMQHADKLKQQAKGGLSSVAGLADDVAAAAARGKTEYKNNPQGLDGGNMHHAVTTTDANGNKIGELVAQDTGNVKRGQVTVRSNQIYDAANRGKGYGKAQIEKLINSVGEDVKAVKSDISTTPDAQRAWASLEKKYPEAISKTMKGDKPVWTVDMDTMREQQAEAAKGADRYKPVQEGATPTLPAPEERQPGRRISQRNPTAIKSTEDPVNGNLIIGKDAIKAADATAPGFMDKMAQTVAKYPGVKITPEEAMANPEKALDKFVNHIADNLTFLHNQVPENIRNISKLWYDSAHVLTKSIAEKYGVAHEQVAAITAALSPKNEWNNNIELAKRVVDTYKTKQATAWTPEMETTAARLASKNPDIADLTELIRGKTLGELKDPDEKAAWIRLYDESHNMSAKANYAPDGSVRGFARNGDNSISKSAWSALSPIVKSVKILEDGSQENIHTMLGEAHKIRNFYNNIIDPWSPHGDVTIDTHAVGAGHLRPMSQATEEVLHNFGSSFKPTEEEAKAGAKASSSIGSSVHGVNGTYGLYADAYRKAAAKLGILPRELQSITWEGIRSLYEAKGKTPELKQAIAKIWEDHTERGLTIDRARKQILKAAGGFKDPGWLSDIKAADAKAAAK